MGVVKVYYYLGNASDCRIVYDIDTGEVLEWSRDKFIGDIDKIILKAEKISVDTEDEDYDVSIDRLIEVISKYAKKQHIYGDDSNFVYISDSVIYLPAFFDVTIDYSKFDYEACICSDGIYAWYKGSCYLFEPDDYANKFVCVAMRNGNFVAVYREFDDYCEDIANEEALVCENISRQEFKRRIILSYC